MAADQLQRRPAPRLGRLPVNQLGAQRKALRQPDILRHRHPFDQAEVLMDEGDALPLIGFGRPVRIGRALEQYLPAVRLVDAGERFDESGLSRAVFAEQRQDFAGKQVKRHIAQALWCRQRSW